MPFVSNLPIFFPLVPSGPLANQRSLHHCLDLQQKRVPPCSEPDSNLSAFQLACQQDWSPIPK